MRIALLILGGILILLSLPELIRGVPALSRLEAYGQGYLSGNLLLFVVGVGLLYLGYRKSKP